MTKNGRDALSVNAVDQAMDKLEWVLYRRKLGRKWRVPLMSRSHFADMVDYFEQNGDAFRLVSVYFSVSVYEMSGYAGSFAYPLIIAPLQRVRGELRVPADSCSITAGMRGAPRTR